MAICFFGFNFWALGLAGAAFFFNLILTSWSIGLIASGLVLKKGLGAEGLAWSMTFLLLPLCCVYYPVADPAGMAAMDRAGAAADACLRGLAGAAPRQASSTAPPC